jgi:hypothetical protein
VPATKLEAPVPNPGGRGFFLIVQRTAVLCRSAPKRLILRVGRAAVKYAEKIFSIRVSKRDGTSKVLKGLHGTPMLNEVIHVPVGKDDVLIVTRAPRTQLRRKNWGLCELSQHWPALWRIALESSIWPRTRADT